MKILSSALITILLVSITSLRQAKGMCPYRKRAAGAEYNEVSYGNPHVKRGDAQSSTQSQDNTGIRKVDMNSMVWSGFNRAASDDPFFSPSKVHRIYNR
jgi:hypothetical protein